MMKGRKFPRVSCVRHAVVVPVWGLSGFGDHGVYHRAMRTAFASVLLVIGAIATSVAGGGVGCGGSSGAQVEAPKNSATVDDEGVSPSTKAAVAAAQSSTASLAKPNADGTITLEPLMSAPDPSAAASFPKQTASDAECFKSVGLTGKSSADYDALIAACGAPTGCKEFVRHVVGKLDDAHHRDTYVLKMLGGYCYRFFAVGDETLGNVDIRVERPDGALVSIDQSKQSIAILDPDATWCKTHDREFHVVVEAKGAGGYALGIWARPKP